MKKKILTDQEKILLRKRSVIETVNDELKNMCQLEHTRHRSVNGFLFNILSALAAYSFFPKKPYINVEFEKHQTNQLSFDRCLNRTHVILYNRYSLSCLASLIAPSTTRSI